VATLLLLLSHASLSWIGMVIGIGIPCAYWWRGTWRNAAKTHFDREFPDISAAVPHVVAHSFGTWLFAETLGDSPFVRAQRVVLVGAVLPCGFDWVSRSTPDTNGNVKVISVRNEIGLSDRVVKLAGLFGRFDPAFGAAGLHGFDEKQGTVHTLIDPMATCELCDFDRAPVHNSRLTRINHTAFLGASKHARAFILPELFGIAPGEFQDFLSLARAARSIARLAGQQDLATLLPVLRPTLHDKIVSWPWRFLGATPGTKETLFQHMETVLFARRSLGLASLDLNDQREHVVDACIKLLMLVADAEVNCRSGSVDREIAISLRPSVAIPKLAGSFTLQT
jgi:hypothetical protein